MSPAAAALAQAVLMAASVAAPIGSAPVPVDRGDSYYQYCLSRQAMHRRDFPAALEHLQRAVEADPRSVELIVDLGRLHLDLNELDKAADAGRRAVALSPGAAPPRRLLAEALFARSFGEEGRGPYYDEARAALEELVRIDPTDAEALLNLGRLLGSRGEIDASLDALRRHLQLVPGSEDGSFLAAQILVRREKADEAVGVLLPAIAGAPENPQLRLALVEAYEAGGRVEQALEEAVALAQLPRVDPVRSRLLLARLYARAGRYADAYDNLTTLAARMDVRGAEFTAQDKAEVHVRRVHALMEAGRFDEAEALAEEGIGRYPEDSRFFLRKGEAMLASGRAEHASGHFAQRLAGRDPAVAAQVSDAYLSAGARRERAGDSATAETHLKRAIELNPANAVALNYLGYMLAEKGERLGEAIDYIRRALEQEPGNGAYLDSLGWAYFKKKDYPRAQEYLESAREALEGEGEIHAHLGDLYHATGRTDEAIQAWQEALERGIANADEIREKLETVRGRDGARR